MKPNSLKVVILYTQAGGGHIAVTKAMQKVLTQQGYEVSILNPYDMVAGCDIFSKVTPYAAEDIYNKYILEKGWKGLFTLFFYGVVGINIQFCTGLSVKRFAARWEEEKPDLVISTIPLSNLAIKKSIEKYRPDVPFIITLTDFHESFKFSWFPKRDDYYVICPTEKAKQQLLKKPHNPSRVIKTSGIMVDPDNYLENFDQAKAREAINLDKDLTTICIMYGSHADDYVEIIAEEIAKLSQNFQVIFLCGKNQALADKLSELNLPYSHIIKSYTKRVPFYLKSSDFFIGKSGALAISEALATGLPLLLDNRQTMIQEKYNLTWVKENNLGLTFNNLPTFLSGFEQLIDQQQRYRFQQNLKAVRNQAIFELPEIIQNILAQPNHSNTC